MKFFIVCLLSAQFCFAQTRKVNAETTIQNVTVFSSGVRVERSGLKELILVKHTLI